MSRKSKSTPAVSDETAAPAKRQGAAPLSDQIASLQLAVGDEGVQSVNHILATYSPEVIRLAFKSLPKVATPKLGKRVEAMLAQVAKIQGSEAADTMRAGLLAAAVA